MLLARPGGTQLVRIAEMLAERPMALLTLAAETITCYGPSAAVFADELRRSDHEELAIVGLAMEWLTTPDGVAGLPPSALARAPLWIQQLDHARLTAAFRRREGVGKDRSSYLIEVQVFGHRPGTIYAEVDHVLDGALVQAVVADVGLETVRDHIRSIERAGEQRGAQRPRPYRRIKPATGQRCLAGALGAAEEAELILDLGSQWPGNRPLLAFLLNDPKLVGPAPPAPTSPWP